MKIDEKRTYGTVHGHPFYCYQQGDKFFDGAKNEIDHKGNLVGEKKPKEAPSLPGDENSESKDSIIPTDGVASAEEFLKNLLQGGAVAKAAIYKEAENTLIKWADVQKAFTTLQIIKTQRANRAEWWQLPEARGEG
jgi:hypothetical protein